MVEKKGGGGGGGGRRVWLAPRLSSMYLHPGTLPPNRTRPSARLQGNACLSKEPWGQPPQQSTARRWRRSSGPVIESSTERFQWCASEALIFVHQSVGPTVRQSLVGVIGGADHFLYLG